MSKESLWLCYVYFVECIIVLAEHFILFSTKRYKDILLDAFLFIYFIIVLPEHIFYFLEMKRSKDILLDVFFVYMYNTGIFEACYLCHSLKIVNLY